MKRTRLIIISVTNWQKKKASQILGINASTLYRKIQRYGLDKMDSNPTEVLVDTE